MSNIKKILNMDDTIYVCVYNINKISFIEIVDKTYSTQEDLGFYTKVNDRLIGVMESEKGPVFFNNERLYYLSELDYTFRHQHITKFKGRFQLLVDGSVKEDITYDIPMFTDYDAWSAEADVDFFSG